MSIPSFRIGDTTISVIQRLPSTAFTANPIIGRTVLRAADGTGHIQNTFEKYTITVSGLAQDTIPDLRFEFQRNDTIELTSLVDRIERISAPGTTSVFRLSRQARDDLPLVVEFPIGTAITASLVSFINSSSLFAQVDIGFSPPAGTNSVLFKYFPIHVGVIESLESDYSYVDDEETWSLVFQEI
jgi:hypothetical protein